MNKKLFTIISKDGEFDFEVSGLIGELQQYEYEELKSILITAIGTMEEMRRYVFNKNEKCVKELGSEE